MRMRQKYTISFVNTLYKFKIKQCSGEQVSQNRYVGKDVFMLQTKSEGVMEEEETEQKAESQVGTDSVDESETRHMTQEERVKIKVDNNGNLWAQRI